MDQRLRELSFVLLATGLLVGAGIALGFSAFTPPTALLFLSAALLGFVFHTEFGMDWKASLTGAGGGLLLSLVAASGAVRGVLFPFSVFLFAPPFLLRGRARIFQKQE